MKQFEYMEHEDIMSLWEQNKNQYTSFTQFLNYLGGLGWEIEKENIAYETNTRTYHEKQYFAKREKIVQQQQYATSGNHRVVAGPAFISR